MITHDQKIETPAALQVVLKLKKAPKGHFANAEGTGLKPGMIYYIYNPVTKVLDNHDYYTSEYTNEAEFIQWYRKGMIYVPVTFFDEIEGNDGETGGN